MKPEQAYSLIRGSFKKKKILPHTHTHTHTFFILKEHTNLRVKLILLNTIDTLCSNHRVLSDVSFISELDSSGQSVQMNKVRMLCTVFWHIKYTHTQNTQCFMLTVYIEESCYSTSDPEFVLANKLSMELQDEWIILLTLRSLHWCCVVLIWFTTHISDNSEVIFFFLDKVTVTYKCQYLMITTRL